MKTLPRISVITPSYNQGRFLEETILSVIGQNYPNLEYIIMDGGSTDDSVAVIKKYEKHLAYWESEKDKGQSHAVNKGMERASGDILCWINSDDLFLPGSFSFLSSLPYNVQDPVLIYGNCIMFKEMNEGLWTFSTNVMGASRSSMLEVNDFINQSSSFWTRTAWEKAGPLREDIHYAFDWEWFLRAQKAGVVLIPVNKGLSMYRVHADHKSAQGGNARRDEILSIYQEYSCRHAALYKMIREEDLSFSTLRNRLARRTLRFLKKPVSGGTILKFIKGQKYKGYTSEEIDKTMSML